MLWFVSDVNRVFEASNDIKVNFEPLTNGICVFDKRGKSYIGYPKEGDSARFLLAKASPNSI